MASWGNQRPCDDEHRLVEQAIEGNVEAFAALYACYLEQIYRYIYYRVADEADAEDLTEEVFVRAWEALPGFELKQHPLKSWLYRIAHNLVIDHQRRRKPVPMPEGDTLVTASSAAIPEESVMLAHDAAVLVAAIKELDEEEQQVVILRFVEDLTHKEVAEIIGKTEGASRVIQHRALHKLKRVLSSRKAK
jgi:RNA polymerase sigma-70 factor (ECF subfamily)